MFSFQRILKCTQFTVDKIRNFPATNDAYSFPIKSQFTGSSWCPVQVCGLLTCKLVWTCWPNYTKLHKPNAHARWTRRMFPWVYDIVVCIGNRSILTQTTSGIWSHGVTDDMNANRTVIYILHTTLASANVSSMATWLRIEVTVNAVFVYSWKIQTHQHTTNSSVQHHLRSTIYIVMPSDDDSLPDSGANMDSFQLQPNCV